MTEAPFIVDDLVSAAIEALKISGDARSIALLVYGKCQLLHWNSDFGIDYWRLFVAVPIQLYYAMNDDDVNATKTAIRDSIIPFFRSKPGDGLDSIEIAPLVESAKDAWRDEAIRFIKGEGVTNQGRVRSDNIASQQHQGLLFRSKAEIVLFNALVKAKLAVSPLPVFIRVGKNYNRLEPDFVVIYKGLTFVVEVDGDTYHKELPAEADKRLVPLTYEGVEVRRIRASDISTESAADLVVKDLIEFMARRKESR